DRLELLPQGKEVRIRGLQTHGSSQNSLEMGQRAAVNLGGIDWHLLKRGNFLATPGHMIPCRHWRATVSLLPNVAPLKSRQRVRVHIGTHEVMARVRPLAADSSLADFHLESLTAASRLDPFVLRSYSPMATIGGGVVIELNPPRITKSHRASEFETAIALSQAKEQDFVRIYLDKRAPYGASVTELIQVSGMGLGKITPWLQDLMARGEVISLGERYLSISSLKHLCQRILEVLRVFHEQKPELLGMERAELRQTALPDIPESLLSAIVKILSDDKKVKVEGSVLSLAEHKAIFSKSHELLAEKLLGLIQGAGFRPPPIADLAKATETPPNEVTKVLALLVKQRRLVRLEPELFFAPIVFQNAISKLRQEIGTRGAVTVGNVAALLDSSRKYVVPFLEHTDKIGVTMRQGDQRVAGHQFAQDNARTTGPAALS
ncbi:MAG: SelB C-terminal domain-containing protein, partial [bacterium]